MMPFAGFLGLFFFLGFVALVVLGIVWLVRSPSAGLSRSLLPPRWLPLRNRLSPPPWQFTPARSAANPSREDRTIVPIAGRNSNTPYWYWNNIKPPNENTLGGFVLRLFQALFIFLWFGHFLPDRAQQAFGFENSRYSRGI